LACSAVALHQHVCHRAVLSPGSKRLPSPLRHISRSLSPISTILLPCLCSDSPSETPNGATKIGKPCNILAVAHAPFCAPSSLRPPITIDEIGLRPHQHQRSLAYSSRPCASRSCCATSFDPFRVEPGDYTLACLSIIPHIQTQVAWVLCGAGPLLAHSELPCSP